MYVIHGKVSYGSGSLLHSDVRREIEIFILRVPAGLARLSGQVHELSGSLLADPVDPAQIPDIAQAGAAFRRLDSADLGSGAEQLAGHLVDGEFEFVAQSAQASCELTLAYGRTRLCHACLP